jgi:[protein-PII] uridylyltransferase
MMPLHTMPDGSPGPDLRSRAAALLAAAREEYAIDARRGAGGLAVLERYSARLDDIVRLIVGNARSIRPLVVCALGGYGRRALSLQSDIDLLIAFDGSIGYDEERVVKLILQPLWDLRLTVGQHVRELTDFDAPETDNAEFLLALLDARAIAGDESLLAGVQVRVQRAAAEWKPALLDSLLALVEQRYDQFSHTLYQLEPDIKNAPGGLRDLAVSRHIRALQPRLFGDETERSARQLDEAEEFLMRIRSLLHLESGRDANTLTHEMQEKVADLLGAVGDRPQLRVEAMMGDYFRHARVVARTLARARQLVLPPAGRGAPRPVGRHYEV